MEQGSATHQADSSVPPVPSGWGAVVTVTVALLVALAETSRLSAQIVSPIDQRPHGIGSLLGPATLVAFDPSATGAAWVAALNAAPAWTFWLQWHTVLRIGMVVLWGLVAGMLLRRRTSTAPVPAAARSFRREFRTNWKRVAAVGVAAAAIDLLECAVVLTMSYLPRPTVGQGWWLAQLVAGITIAKLVALLGLAAAVVLWLVKDDEAGNARAALGRWCQALLYQRLPLLVIGPLAALALVPRGDISDQVPDVQRAWADGPAGWAQAGLAFAALVVVAAGLFVLGRLRSDHVARLVPELGLRRPLLPGVPVRPLGRFLTYLSRLLPGALPASPTPVVAGAVARGRYPLWVWFVWPASLAGAFLWVAATGRGEAIWLRLLLFCAPAVGIGVASAGLRLRMYRDPRHAPVPTTPDLAQFRVTALVGDLLAVALLAVGGLGLVRSYTAPLMLGLAAAAQTAEQGPEPDWVVPLAAVGLGAGLAILPWYATPPALRLLDRLDPTGVWARWLRPGHTVALPEGLRIGFVVVTIGLVFAVVGVQRLAAAGVVGVTLVSLGCLALAVGALQVVGQDRHPPEIFWLPWLRQRSAPVVSLTLLALLFAATLGAGGPAGAVHRVHPPASPQLPDRPDLAAALDLWLAARPECGAPVATSAGEIRVRPMLFVAAEGGGIRATYWTTQTLALLQSTDAGEAGCRGAFLSTGASGGAVGLTLSRFLPPGTAASYAGRVATSDALARATQGLLVRDTFYSATGVGLQADPGWTDRAAAIEDAWVGATSADGAAPLADGFLTPPGEAVAHPTGFLVLGSTSVGTGCRVLLSQLRLPSPVDPLQAAGIPQKPGSAPVPCDGSQAPAARSFDLFASYGQGGEPTCTGNLRAVTVALLASRFPYVTPSGVVGPCGTWREDQLVDGGYEENTGLGAIVDLSPVWARMVRSHNDQVLTAGHGTVVVPMVAFLTNGDGADLLPSDRAITQELLVPPVAFLRGSSSQNSPNALLQRVAGLTSGTPWTVTSQSLPPDVLAAVAGRRTFVVFPATRPGVAAPLGWTLSRASREELAAKAVEQAARRCPAGESVSPQDPVADILCLRGYGTLGDAAALMATLS